MNETILYLECSSGISGDMTVAALLDLGADRQVLLDALKSLPLSGYSIEIKDVYKSGIRACDFHVILDAEHENHDHDMEYLHGSGHVHEAHAHDAEEVSAEVLPESIHAETACQFTNDTHSHTHSHAHSHTEETCAHSHMDDGHTHSRTHTHLEEACAHSHAGNCHTHSHHARNLQDIVEIIQAGSLNAAAADLAIRIFEIVAKAEAKVHGKGINEVHFHEVGAVDSIVDIVAAAVCLDNLHPDQVVVSALTEGCGQIRCQHGLIPIPVPAVTAIAEQEDLVLRLTDIQGELVTPTGAAIAAAVRTKEKLPEQFRIRRTGLGAGKRAYATAGVLRAMLVEPSGKSLPSAPARQGSPDIQTHTLRLKNPHCQQGIAAPAEANNLKCTATSTEPGSLKCTAASAEPDSLKCTAASTEPDSQKRTAASMEPDSLKCTAASAEPDSLKCTAASAESDAPAASAAQIITGAPKITDESADTILVLETNIDDCTGEAVAFTMQQLLEAGALDVFSIPIYMKKNRPAWLLKTICEPKDREVLEAIIFQNTTTIGIRRQTMQRTKLPRKIMTVETDWGVADIKCCDYGQTMRYFPENDSVSRLAVENGIGFPEMYRLLQEFAQKHLSGTSVFS